jgi:hypothetical protein
MYKLSRQLWIKCHKKQPIIKNLLIYDNDNMVEVMDIFLRLLRVSILLIKVYMRES